MSLSATLRVTRGATTIDVDLEGADGETVALVGPNGAGKTTVLDALAGLIPLTAGRVVAGTAVLEDTVAGIRVGPERRPVGYVFQDLLLFPHLSVADNVAFGLRARGVRRGDARRRALAALDAVSLAGLSERPPVALSGGEAQRVALVRALVTEPAVLLLDEPLAAADVGARRDMRRVLRSALAGFGGTRVLVTHDPVEASALADRLVVIEEGRVVQQGRPEDVRAAPRTPFVAGLAGLNLFRGEAAGTRVTVAGGGEIALAEPADGQVFVVVRPESVSLHAQAPGGSPRNVWRLRVRHVEPEGTRVRVDLGGAVALVAEVTPAAAHELALRPGLEVWASVKATEVTAHPV